MFKLVAPYQPTGDQPQAIRELVSGIENNIKNQVLLGATGTGKTFTMANVITTVQKPTLILVHNKTLAMQLYGELKTFFPENRVEYFVSYFDFYQPEAYLPKTDVYIDKNSKINQEIEMLRLSTLNALSTSKDVIVVASVAAIYGAQDPEQYKQTFFELRKDTKINRQDLLHRLVLMGYERNDLELKPGTFSAKGDVIKIAPSWTDQYFLRVSLFGDEIEEIAKVDTLNANVLERYPFLTLFPAQDYISTKERVDYAVQEIAKELEVTLAKLRKNNFLLEAQRLEQRTNNDLESLREFGICNGMENYARFLEKRSPGSAPYTLFDFFPKDFLTIIDESHMTLPQVRGMYLTDRHRKETLVKYGFRLPSALDNRPLNFEEFKARLDYVVYTSATPGDYELELIKKEKSGFNQTIQQVIRPTGLLDPTVEIKPSLNQINDIIEQIKARAAQQERVFITTLTIRMAEELTAYLQEQKIKVAYLHNELKTLERTKVLLDLRRGVYDAVVGINLLREGLDVPEVSLICILDADKSGFLRNTRSLVQTIGRAARNVHGHVILYADEISLAMKEAIGETERRRNIQIAYNKEHNITPVNVKKPLSEIISTKELDTDLKKLRTTKGKERLTAKAKIIAELRVEMLEAAKALNFEKAAALRDLILNIESDDDTKNDKGK
ncbi:excinuclease ABC subunit UvrB [Spiroplasma platyhelix]|uniref:UvrABC system protein B n=1 Tax=Spiroplasma platyhelix PALS-1 TaxID=1276218 RepID=A0A846TX55_9MOLU|nr:excinuclease ABC subunit UvrB [Spiroplasma platyhelix]MBE4704268.1 UvrABC system protein B [Spiroplasma platyhelix PALS-1]NKE38641.1 excinuclease ABC subunit UvrB [Spiroplasma platyhelix PALS-1]UJB28852.1 excinuclease ABC subunit B [Spiroplasma platyhelix PALS-1]